VQLANGNRAIACDRRLPCLRPPLQRLGHAAVVHDFCSFLVLFFESEEGQLDGHRRATAMNIKADIISACLAVATPAAAQGRGEVITPNFEHAIPNIPGKSLVAVVVDYAPGGASRSHTHAKSAFIYAYVVSGVVESQVNDGPKRVYHAGESFYELPGAHHAVSRNASATEPAKLLAVFVVDTDDKALTTPDK
jgi:quercetin dioxygenase-like cupin family protein